MEAAQPPSAAAALSSSQQFSSSFLLQWKVGVLLLVSHAAKHVRAKSDGQRLENGKVCLRHPGGQEACSLVGGQDAKMQRQSVAVCAVVVCVWFSKGCVVG